MTASSFRRSEPVTSNLQICNLPSVSYTRGNDLSGTLEGASTADTRTCSIRIMQCITTPECLEWLTSHRLETACERGFPEVVGNFEVFFAAPDKARTQGILAGDLVDWVGKFEKALFWISDWPSYRPEEMALVSSLRRGHGETRWLIDAPGHLFDWDEREELVGWVSLMMAFGWDGYMFAAPFDGKMFQTSHEDFVWATSDEAASFSSARQIPRKYQLEIYREGPVPENKHPDDAAEA